MQVPSDRALINSGTNLILLAITILSWAYVIAAGRFVSERYLQKIDLSLYQDERISQFLNDI